MGPPGDASILARRASKARAGGGMGRPFEVVVERGQLHGLAAPAKGARDEGVGDVRVAR